jgi:hypothetical protein
MNPLFVYKFVQYKEMSFLVIKNVILFACLQQEKVVLVYKCGQEKLNNLYYQMKEQRR